MTLDKRPDLTRHLHKGDDEGQKSLVETTAECIQRAFTICLTERTASGSGVLDGQPAGKKIGIYSFANLVLKLLFRCRKTSLAEQLFTNINQNSPPLALYPAAQRVTYLYYLGRFYLANTHYYKAQQCLQEAFKQCHRQCASQRKEILTYLVACNLILGRCPTPALMKFPECAEVLQLFAPLSIAIRKGDICAFKKFLGPENPHYAYLFSKGLLLPLLYRAEVLVWRNLARRVFILTYEVPTDPNSRKAPTLSIHDLLTAAKLCQHRLEASPNPLEKRKLKPSLGVIYGNLQPTLADMEAVVAALVAQDLLHGYVSHNLKRFAILGSKLKGGPLLAGFPIPWRVIQRRALDGVGADSAEVDVTGWVTKEAGGFKGGVVNLTGIARPVGV
jgi:tetratricopeptide (TPR) repeat protein